MKIYRKDLEILMSVSGFLTGTAALAAVLMSQIVEIKSILIEGYIFTIYSENKPPIYLTSITSSGLFGLLSDNKRYLHVSQFTNFENLLKFSEEVS